MPHNLYLHSSIVQTRDWQPNTEKRWEAIKYGTIDSTVALSFALFINSAILIVLPQHFIFLVIKMWQKFKMLINCFHHC